MFFKSVAVPMVGSTSKFIRILERSTNGVSAFFANYSGSKASQINLDGTAVLVDNMV